MTPANFVQLLQLLCRFKVRVGLIGVGVAWKSRRQTFTRSSYSA